MTGKQKFLESSGEDNNESPNINYERFDQPPEYQSSNSISPHCTTCSCAAISPNQEPTDQQIIVESPLQSPVSEEGTFDTNAHNSAGIVEQKEVNFKDGPQIYDQNQLEGCSSSIIEDGTKNNISYTLSNKTSNYDCNPVIYDQTQLNSRSNPIIEDPPENSNYDLEEIIDTNTSNTSKHTAIDSHNPFVGAVIPMYNGFQKENESKDISPPEYCKTENIKLKRPTTLKLNTDDDNVKKKLDDVHVIYDPGQLKMGSSPIIEDPV